MCRLLKMNCFPRGDIIKAKQNRTANHMFRLLRSMILPLILIRRTLEVRPVFVGALNYSLCYQDARTYPIHTLPCSTSISYILIYLNYIVNKRWPSRCVSPANWQPWRPRLVPSCKQEKLTLYAVRTRLVNPLFMQSIGYKSIFNSHDRCTESRRKPSPISSHFDFNKILINW